MRRDFCRMKSVNGITLLEMMIAVAVAVLVMALAAKGYMIICQSQRQQRAFAVQYYNAERLVSLLDDEIGYAGNIGCASIQGGVSVVSYNSHSLSVENALEINKNALEVRYQSSKNVELLQDMQDESHMIAVSGKQFRPGQILLISDCSHAEIFEVESLLVFKDRQLIRAVRPLHNRYRRFAEVGLFMERRYFLRRKSGKGFAALVREEVDGRTTELISGISSLEVARLGNGVHYSFATIDTGSHHLWYKYAAMLARIKK